METNHTVEELVRENMRLRKIKAAAKKVIAFTGSSHHDDCDTQWTYKPCNCGITELAESLEEK